MSWAVNIMALLILWLAGSDRYRRIAWCLGVVSQGMWLAFAYIEGQPGFYLSAPVFTLVYLRNLKREEAHAPTRRPEV